MEDKEKKDKKQMEIDLIAKDVEMEDIDENVDIYKVIKDGKEISVICNQEGKVLEAIDEEGKKLAVDGKKKDSIVKEFEDRLQERKKEKEEKIKDEIGDNENELEDDEIEKENDDKKDELEKENSEKEEPEEKDEESKEEDKQKKKEEEEKKERNKGKYDVCCKIAFPDIANKVKNAALAYDHETNKFVIGSDNGEGKFKEAEEFSRGMASGTGLENNLDLGSDGSNIQNNSKIQAVIEDKSSGNYNYGIELSGNTLTIKQIRYDNGKTITADIGGTSTQSTRLPSTQVQDIMNTAKNKSLEDERKDFEEGARNINELRESDKTQTPEEIGTKQDRAQEIKEKLAEIESELKGLDREDVQRRRQLYQEQEDLEQELEGIEGRERGAIPTRRR